MEFGDKSRLVKDCEQIESLARVLDEEYDVEGGWMAVKERVKTLIPTLKEAKEDDETMEEGEEEHIGEELRVDKLNVKQVCLHFSSSRVADPFIS